ncbi:MAG: hypothetical protein HYX60_11050 [Legionella longbeachae]|nr:hypothetical protein [Legionella longbeachae]
MGLKEIVSTVEKDIGLISVTNKTIEKGHTHTIPFALKPSEQLMSALRGPKDTHLPIVNSPTSVKTSDNKDVTIKGFSTKTAQQTLTISGTRLDRLLSSAKIYVNTNVFPDGLYQKAIKEKLVNNKNKELPPEVNGTHWENLAVGVCHAQEVDLLVGTIMSGHKRAHTTVREGKIDKETPALLLLSSPCLNLRSELKVHLDKKNQIRFIEGMFRNLFDATQKEGRQYIAMSAAALGKNSVKPELYFAALMNVAKEFPDLNIIYHPVDHENAFDKALKNAKLENVAKASKNIIFMADKLTQMGKLCALHMPTNSDVIYGLSDENSQTYLGTVSTSAVNSFSVNPQAFATVIERNLTWPTNSVIKTKILDNKNNINLPAPSCKSEEHKVEQITKNEEKLTVNANSTDSPPLVEQIDETVKETETPSGSDEIIPNIIFSPVQIEQEPPASDLPIQNATDKVIVISSPGKNGIFPPSKPVETPPRLEPTSSSLSKKQVFEINHTIDCLTGEIQSCWPYPNKALKQIKVDALNALIKNARTMNIHDAIAAVKQEYPKAVEGNWSTRTADLFNKLERQSIAVNSMI